MPHNYERDTELPDERNSVSFFFCGYCCANAATTHSKSRALLVAAADRRYLAERETIFLVLIVDDEVVESLAFRWLLVRQRRDDLATTQQDHTAFNSVQKLNVTYCWLRRTNVL